MKALIYLLGVLVAVACLFSACNEEDENEYPVITEETIKLANDATFGPVLTDGDGFTLYFFAKDVKGNSLCNGNCADAWPAFFTEKVEVGNGLDKSDFATIEREDGSKQTTFKGWPLYYFAQDENAGDVNGDGLGDVWFVGKPDYTVMIGEQSIEGQIQLQMVSQEGNSLYFFLQDKENDSNCNGGCLANWPAFFDDSLVLPSFLEESDFAVFDRDNGEKQLAYKGMPMYFFANDNQRGDINGHEVGDVWFLFGENALLEDF